MPNMLGGDQNHPAYDPRTALAPNQRLVDNDLYEIDPATLAIRKETVAGGVFIVALQDAPRVVQALFDKMRAALALADEESPAAETIDAGDLCIWECIIVHAADVIHGHSFSRATLFTTEDLAYAFAARRIETLFETTGAHLKTAIEMRALIDKGLHREAVITYRRFYSAMRFVIQPVWVFAGTDLEARTAARVARAGEPEPGQDEP